MLTGAKKSASYRVSSNCLGGALTPISSKSGLGAEEEGFPPPQVEAVR